MPKILFITTGFIFGVIVLITIIGFFLPNPRIATNNFSVSSPINIVWNQITDHKNQVDWRKSLKDISISEENSNQWTETPITGPPITFKTTESLKHSIYRIDILPISGFQGYALIEFSEEGKYTQLTFTEASIIPNPFRRILAYIFYNPKKSMKIYEKELKESLTL